MALMFDKKNGVPSRRKTRQGNLPLESFRSTLGPGPRSEKWHGMGVSPSQPPFFAPCIVHLPT